MISIDEHFIMSVAPNADTAKNGRSLLLKGQFSQPSISAEKTLIFGHCQGSGKTPYACSCDFANAATPVFRCSCPSRQFPCKHCVGLMLAFVQKPASFQEAEVPDDLKAKREKAEARTEKKKVEVDKPKQVNKSALAKKIKAQLDGLDLLERLTHSLVSLGIGNMNVKSAREVDEQARQLGDTYLPGAQKALRAYTSLFSAADGRFADDMSATKREEIYSEAFEKLATLYSLAKTGRAYLEKRLGDPELKPETDTSITAWLGHAWQLSELRREGLVQSDASLLQLAFNTHDDVARQEWIDTGIWCEVITGKVYTTKNYRPYKAAKYIKSEDSFSQIAQVPELYIYPGDMNQRIRWEGMTSRPPTEADYAAVQRAAATDFVQLIKEIKSNLKGPLSEKQPVCLLKFARIGTVADSLVVEDGAGNRLTMTDRGIAEEPPSMELLRLIPNELHRNQTLVARFGHDLDARKLEVKPLAIVAKNSVVRLTL
ncbi:MAG: hypothetical protein Q8M16_20715 [Pirellulaceae bacterium]|nr:hypothetical protein [Pirellulaceae bacterium]